jgi:hypothetical protein
VQGRRAKLTRLFAWSTEIREPLLQIAAHRNALARRQGAEALGVARLDRGDLGGRTIEDAGSPAAPRSEMTTSPGRRDAQRW